MVARKLLVLSLAAVAATGCAKKNKAARRVREALRDELKPVALSNCTLQRVGSVNDGGYLMCENLVQGVEALYSYGIEHEDNWGCELSRKFGVPVQQYDCFTPDRPTCDGGKYVFHAECIGNKAETQQGKPFDTLSAQIAKNGDKGKRLIVKMDVEGAEWDSLLATPDDVLERIDQLPMELHGVNEPKFLDLVKKLKKTFYLVSVHFNNFGCSPSAAPLPSSAYQVLFVNKRLGVVDPSAPGRQPGSPPDAPDNPNAPDCQSIVAAH